MKIAFIVAMANNRVIGLKNQMPWHLAADLKKFQQITTGHTILMGRKTHESIGRALPKRRNIIVSRNANYAANNCEVFHDLETALASCSAEKTVFVIGGATLYAKLLNRVDILYITEIKQDFNGDTYFPAIDPSQWQEISREDITNDNNVDFSYSFLTFTRIKH